MEEPSKDRHIKHGRWGEDQASLYLQQAGYRIIARNWRCRSGEIDIIACDADVLVFVEVRTRSGPDFGTPEESVDQRKQRKVRHVSDVYLYMNSEAAYDEIRFDVIAVYADRDYQHADIHHIKDAF